MTSTAKTALITGGAKGIGKACSIELSKQGYNVIINYNTSRQEAEELASSLQNAIAIKADISNVDDVNRMLDKAYATFNNIDVLINNAGIAQQKLFTDITEQDWDLMFDTNVKGMFNVCKGVLPKMIQNRYGKIVNVSSMWGIAGASCEVHYSASKAAIIGFTKALAKEVGLSNINVNCVAPGVIMTDMNSNLDEQTLESLKEETPLNCLGTPQNVADVIAFLVSGKAEFITGQIISPNGGIVI